MSNQIDIDASNAEELTSLARDAMNEADGIVPEEKEPTAEAEAPAEETAPEETPEPQDGLEIKPKEESSEEEAPADEEPKTEYEPVDLESIYTDYAETGVIDPDVAADITARLKAVGFGDEAEAILQQYMAGYQASVEVAKSTAHSIAGGAESYAAMTQWAADNLSAAEISAYNEAVNQPNMQRFAISGLKAQYEAATGGATTAPTAPTGRVASGPVSTAGLEPITSTQQIATLTADPRFDTDPGYRAQVERRIQASMDAGLLK